MESHCKLDNIKTLKDYITGTVLGDDPNERVRQKIFRFLVEEKGFDRKDLKPRQILKFPFRKGLSIIDLSVFVNESCVMIVRYGLSSIVTRHRSALSAARIYSKKHLPYVVVTNGENADILDGKSGKVLSSGLNSIPSKAKLKNKLKLIPDSFPFVSKEQIDMEYKILYSFDVL
ncbi:MAG: type I restriction enzyme HsdR N-terminal domain-containing protein [Deltaproteobacteria bacterium]|nr:type I restriction enzyme HsdR N-terminal domain-containing protein [Deltaproteobacteria bacterium]